MIHLTRPGWNRERPESLVIACSDGRLQENLDDFLHLGLGITHYDRLYAPGGAGALAAGGSVELLRPDQWLRECRFLLAAHPVQRLYLIFHGPSEDGPEEAVCGDYRRRLPRATMAEIRRRQQEDAAGLKRLDWGRAVQIHAYRCEVRADGRIQFVEL